MILLQFFINIVGFKSGNPIIITLIILTYCCSLCNLVVLFDEHKLKHTTKILKIISIVSHCLCACCIIAMVIWREYYGKNIYSNDDMRNGLNNYEKFYAFIVIKSLFTILLLILCCVPGESLEERNLIYSQYTEPDFDLP